MSLKINSLIFGIILALSIIPLISADNGNVTPNTTPFIAIDPIGNHTIDEAFFINGTTNLAAFNKSLKLIIFEPNPSGVGSSYTSNVSIQSGKNGVNTWSGYVIPSQWTTSTLHGASIPNLVNPGDYTVIVESPGADDTQFFSLLPSESGSTPTQTSTTPTMLTTPSLITSTVGTSTGITTSPTRPVTLLPMIVWPLHKEEFSKKISTIHFAPSKDFTEYINAPSITEIQKIDALMIASTSTQNSHLSSAANAGATHKSFGDYLRSSHGPITIEWAYPYRGNVRLSMPVGSLSSNEYGLAYALVNIDNVSILSDGFVDWHNYW